MKILILTSEYPNDYSSYDTPVVHFYAKEWQKMGHDIRVVHFRSTFPHIYYKLFNKFKNLTKKIIGTDFIPTQRLDGPIISFKDSVKVRLSPIYKVVPHQRYSKSVIKNEVVGILDWLHEEKYSPDYIVGHFLNPQLEMLHRLKEKFPNCKTSLVIHEDISFIKKIYGREAHILLNHTDYIGLRFPKMQKAFLTEFKVRSKSFICPSGIPTEFIDEELNSSKFKSDHVNICFVGMLIPLKNVDVLIISVAKAFPKKNFTLHIVGDGMLMRKLMQLVIKLDINENVIFYGRKERIEVQYLIRKCDLFVMVSKPEAFGLVYVEALAKGCITVGTYDQGIDGVILNGINGFLCKPRDVNDLTSTLVKINNLTYQEKCNIGRKALETAKSLDNTTVARKYLLNIDIRNNEI